MIAGKNKLHDIRTWPEYVRYRTKYCAEIRHLGLGTHRVLKDFDEFILNNKISAQYQKWDTSYAGIQSRDAVKQAKEKSKHAAEELTESAKSDLKRLDELLLEALYKDEGLDWDALKDRSKFPNPNPKLRYDKLVKAIRLPQPPIYKKTPKPPEKIEPKIGFLDNIIKSFKESKLRKADTANQFAMEIWQNETDKIVAANEKKRLQYEKDQTEIQNKIADLESQSVSAVAKWNDEMDVFYDRQIKHNERIDRIRASYERFDEDGISEYCEIILNMSEYPESFPKDFNLNYNKETELLAVDYVLPSPEHLPRLAEVKYIAARQELKEYFLTDAKFAKLYDETIYKIILRILHELFVTDKIQAIQAIALNGWVESIDKRVGKTINACIVSIHVNKVEFTQIDLRYIEPRACFKNLKGVGSSKLIQITPIKPIIQLDKNDRRFIASYDVADTLDDGINIAAMKWDDFEHLVRELFEKEFKTSGGDVKVTRSSRDGGVDAIAFDPDPIRGGKIVIQAKRYTNTVGVSAIRDLYGTVLNEGASKGILVTTSDYGPDAYDFAKNKPLTLMNGANLLHLLLKHGHKAKIDLKEAKIQLALKENQD